MTKKRAAVLATAALAVALLVAGIVGFARPDGGSGGAAAPPVVGDTSSAVAAVPAGAPLDELIVNLQDRLEATPGDYPSWATLGLAYVQQAKVTGDPSLYPRAEGALEQSLEVNRDDNFGAYAGLSALASARHDFRTAKEFADRGLEINPYSSLLYGALGDAELQLGNYPAAFAAVDRMAELSPDTASLSRLSYTWELRGDVTKATELMQRAADDAPNGATRAFALVQLGELAFGGGDVNGALRLFASALEASPDDPAAMAGKAKAEAALGQTQTALDHYAELVQRAPDPAYLVAYGDLLQSVGRRDDAQAQYDIVATAHRLFAANGVQPDASSILFAAEQGDAGQALADAEVAIAANPFVATYDAYAWALHKNGRHAEALEAVTEASRLGTRSALFRYHAGMIKLALGDAEGARVELTTALQINPAFDPLAVPLAHQTLVDVGGAP